MLFRDTDQVFKIFLLNGVWIENCCSLVTPLTRLQTGGHTCVWLGPMVNDFINSWTCLLGRGCPVVGRHIVILLLKRILLVLVIVCDLLGTARRESDFGMGGGKLALGNQQPALPLLLAGNISTSSGIII